MKTENRESLWNPIRQAADEQSFQFRFPTNEIIPEVPGVQDWIAKRVIQGYPAVFLLTLSVVVAGVYRWESSVLACAPVWALLLTFLFRPLARNRSGGFSYGGMALVWLIAILLTPVLNLTSAGVLQKTQYGFLQSELPAYYLQGSLEQLFSPGHFLLLLGLGAVVFTCQAVCRHRYFWLLEPSESRVRSYLPLLIPTVLLAGFIAMSTVATKEFSPRQQTWLREVKQKLEGRPFGVLPEYGEDDYWSNQVDQNRGKAIFQAARDEQDHQPTSVQELNSYAYYLQRSAESGGRPEDMLEDLSLQCRAIPYVNLDFNFGFLSKQIMKTPADKAALQNLADKLKTVHQQVPGFVDTLDLAAYRHLHETKYHATFSTGSWSAYQLKQHERKHDAFEIRPLKLLGFSFSPSPTEIYHQYQRRRLLDEWLDLKAAGLPAKDLQRGRLFGARQDAYNDSTIGRKFWFALAYQDQVDTIKAKLQGLAVMVAIRQYQARTGSLPRSLEGLVDQPERYEWRLQDGQGVLRSKGTDSEVPGSPVRFGGVQ